MKKIRSIPENFLKLNRIFGFPRLNVIEAVIWAIIIALIITSINFVPKVKIICLIVYECASLAFNLKGIKGRSIMQFIYQEIKFKKNNRKLHFAPATKTISEAKWQQGNEGETYLMQFIKHSKEKYYEFLGRK